MLIYWLLFLLPAFAVLFPGRLRLDQQWVAWTFCGVVTISLIGLRHEVGGDWFNYEAHFWRVSQLSLLEALSYSDPGYYVLNWFVARLGGNIYWVNIICAVLIVGGTFAFCRSQPRPWTAYAVAVPYLLVVVGMGYSRQAVAVALSMVGFVALGRGRTAAFVGWVVLAATFHKSAVLLIPIAALSAQKGRIWNVAWVIVAAVAAYLTLMDESAGRLWDIYVGRQRESQGALVRVAMNAVPALILLVLSRRITLSGNERKLWSNMALLALGCVPLVFFASTAVDRMALYLIPIQLFVFGRIAMAFRLAAHQYLVECCVVGYYAVVMLVWLNFAAHADAWLPYQFASILTTF